jgi:predicted AAA+ superfamily ATPase
MINRKTFDKVRLRLTQFDSVAHVGPRQVGKSTLARELVAEAGQKVKYLDLESLPDRQLLDDPDAYFSAYMKYIRKGSPLFVPHSSRCGSRPCTGFAPGDCWAIEIKLSSTPTVDRGFHNAADDLSAKRRILIYNGEQRFPMREVLKRCNCSTQ